MVVRTGTGPVASPTNPAQERSRRTGGLRPARRETLYGYAFLGPALVLFLVFIAGPMLGAIALSFFSWDLFSTREFVGLRNYRDLLDDQVARRSIKNSFVFAF